MKVQWRGLLMSGALLLTGGSILLGLGIMSNRAREFEQPFLLFERPILLGKYPATNLLRRDIYMTARAITL